MSLMTADLSNQIPTVLIMLGIICLIGIFGNTLVIIVYSLKQDRLTATLFILILAISDFLACITLIPGTMIIEYVEWNIDSTFLCKFYYFINNTFIPFSSLLISCIAFDRYFCLCHPFKNILTRERAKRVILILIFICIILGFSSTFTVRVEQIHFDTNINNNNDNNNNNNRYSNKTIDYNSTIKFDYSFNSYYKSEKFECTEILKLNHTMIETVLYQIVQKSQTCSYILCILCVVTLYILIYRSVSKVFKKRLELKGVKKENKKHKKIEKNHRKKENCEFTLRNLFNYQSKKIQISPMKLTLTNQDNPFTQCDGFNRRINNTIISESSYTETMKPLNVLSCNTIDIKNNEEMNDPSQKHDHHDHHHQQQHHHHEEQQQQHHHHHEQQQKQPQTMKSNTLVPINCCHNTESVMIQPITLNYETNLIINEEKTRRSMKTIKDNIAFQNLKTAAMLFVVAVVYIVTFIPAMLMAIQYVPLYLPIFYLYYINNAINPIIYGFMNPNFRADIHLLICQKLKCI
ncbi:unnamed protein product [Schistosoma mattheei]|uniref:Uncharacterized protein n=1 Tax=Schistosoma mattheei TaxID=31246 RepID=A0A183NUH2_9TREM|nr:unnamed protein product [Schistosoma mattheei]